MKMNIMKKIISVCIIITILFLITSCEKAKAGEKDKIVEIYSGKIVDFDYDASFHAIGYQFTFEDGKVFYVDGRQRQTPISSESLRNIRIGQTGTLKHVIRNNKTFNSYYIWIIEE